MSAKTPLPTPMPTMAAVDSPPGGAPVEVGDGGLAVLPAADEPVVVGEGNIEEAIDVSVMVVRAFVTVTVEVVWTVAVAPTTLRSKC
jgi:hypothetical protein